MDVLSNLKLGPLVVDNKSIGTSSLKVERRE